MHDTLRLENHYGTKMIAHRGLSGLEAENTAAAFTAAGRHSFFGIETDVHVTRDGQFILIHDDDTLRVTGVSLPVEGSDFDALRKLRVLDQNGKADREDLSLSTLPEYIRICRQSGKTAVLELKNPMPPKKLQEIISCIRGLAYLENTIFISFALENLVYVRRALPLQKAQYLIEDKYPDDLMETLKRYRLDLDAEYVLITKERLNALHAAGIEVNVWTVNTPEDAERLCRMGVDYITSNIVE